MSVRVRAGARVSVRGKGRVRGSPLLLEEHIIDKEERGDHGGLGRGRGRGRGRSGGRARARVRVRTRGRV